jgi:hypothetical protein
LEKNLDADDPEFRGGRPKEEIDVFLQDVCHHGPCQFQ